jgi:TPR repeat protein
VCIDVKKALEYCLASANQGYAEAQYNLGTLYHEGRGVEVSHDEAVKWYTLAADQGDSNALYNLGSCYVNGHGVAMDLAEALPLFRRAASMGHPEATVMVSRIVQHLGGTSSSV